MTTYLEFEKPIEVLDSKIVELKSLNDSAPSEDMLDKISKVELEISDTYKKISRNSPCPCGSGKKYKHCHGNIS